MTTHGSLGSFDLSRGDWKTYIERADLYFTANGIDDGEKKRAILLSCCGDAAYRRIKDVLSPQAPTAVSYEEICGTLATHFQPEPSEIVQQFRFNTRTRQPHESVATYVTQLKRMAEPCNFGDERRLNEMIRDRLVCGIANAKWQQRLLAEEGLTYETAYKLLLSLEAAEKHVKDLHAPSVEQLEKVQKVHSSHATESIRQHRQTDHTERPVKPCYRCGKQHSPDVCRFKDAECRFCHKKGHIAAVCRKRKGKSKPRAVLSMPDQVAEPPEYADLKCVVTDNRKPLVAELELNSVPVKMEINTGATLSIMSSSKFSSTWPAPGAPVLKSSRA